MKKTGINPPRAKWGWQGKIGVEQEMEKNIHTEERENIRFSSPQRYYENKNISKFEHFMCVEHWPKWDSARAVFLALRRQLFSFIPCLMVKDTTGSAMGVCKVLHPTKTEIAAAVLRRPLARCVSHPGRQLCIYISTQSVKKSPTWCTEH